MLCWCLLCVGDGYVRVRSASPKPGAGQPCPESFRCLPASPPEFKWRVIRLLQRRPHPLKCILFHTTGSACKAASLSLSIIYNTYKVYYWEGPKAIKLELVVKIVHACQRESVQRWGCVTKLDSLTTRAWERGWAAMHDCGVFLYLCSDSIVKAVPSQRDT